jgi:hypothetical protein
MHNNNAKNFVLIMVVIAVLGLLLRFAVEKIIQINIAQNESQAQGTLKFIAAAVENYARDSHGAYPAIFSALLEFKPPYLDKDYLRLSPLKGYNYSCPRMEASGYSCYAVPLKCKLTGRVSFTVSTGGLLISEGCSKKE